MNTRSYIYVSSLFFICGLLLFSITQGWIIIRIPGIHGYNTYSDTQELPHKKKVILYYWMNDTWHTESTDILWSSKPEYALYHLVSQWLCTAEDERVITKKITLESALCDAKHTDVYLSFDRIPFAKQSSTFEKWMFIEGLLKTIRDQNVGIERVHLLVHHQQLKDPHLDFTNPWPTQGFK